MINASIFKSVVHTGLSRFQLSNCRTIYSKNKRNYYDILQLQRNCTSKEIKQAYIYLSKKYHPDRNNNIDSQQFLDVSEAYNVLSKDALRRNYDLDTFPLRKLKRDMYYGQSQRRRDPMDDPSFYRNRDKRKDHFYEAKPYYGIKGLPRMSNSVIMIGCLLLMAVGIGVQVLAIRHSVTFRREEMMHHSAMAAENLENSRKIAAQNGNQMQLAILEEKFRELD